MGEYTGLGPEVIRHTRKWKHRNSFEQWLYEGYPLRMDYTASSHVNGNKMVDDSRDSCGNFVNTDASGRPSDDIVIDRLSGIPCSRVDEALALLETSRKLNGPELVAALRYRIFANCPRPDVETDDTIRKRAGYAANVIESMVFQRQSV